MNYHDYDPDCIDPLVPELGGEVRLLVRTAARAGQLVYLHHGELVRLELTPVAGGLEARVPVVEPVLRYAFFLEGRFFGSRGDEGSLPRYDRFFHLLTAPGVPDWAVGRVFYQIFPDRFRNGRPELSPRSGEWSYQGRPIVAKSWDAPPDPRQGAREFYGGDLWGVLEALDYLDDLGAGGLYLTPIFKSPSSHRYDTEDYHRIDPHLGGREAFDALVGELRRRGMKLVLDGVFNHTGDRFFGFREALENPHSPWREAFTFLPGGQYAAFFGVPTLPKLNYASELVWRYFVTGPGAVVRRWIRAGADGWRLDVAQQIGEGGTDRGNARVLRAIKEAARAEDPAAYVFGELAFDTVPYLRAHTLDGAMHYAGFANPLLEWLGGRDWYGHPVRTSAAEVWRTLWDHYTALPLGVRQAMYTLIGSHDVPRPLWRLRGDVEKLKLLFGVLLTFPGAPGLYYGDEIGLDQANPYDEWRGDPMNRGTFPWEPERWNQDVRGWVRRLVRLRRERAELSRGGLLPLAGPEGALAYRRRYRGRELWVLAAPEPVRWRLPRARELVADREVEGELEWQGTLVLEPLEGGGDA
ncbi:glycoside hydrolase family 13 protein [Oceanithermus sp.]|uniref:glycoside hydrolase family 13 protein n=1 Tax=Oceanithermus sp. TaxID=2268145 RepID=UPI0025795B0A|nr:glycoside hydrolase family 13 protein [Oceanithermus sp.]